MCLAWVKGLVLSFSCRNCRHCKFPLSSGFWLSAGHCAVSMMCLAPAEVTSLCISVGALSAPLECASMKQTRDLLLIQVSLVLPKLGPCCYTERLWSPMCCGRGA